MKINHSQRKTVADSMLRNGFTPMKLSSDPKSVVSSPIKGLHIARKTEMDHSHLGLNPSNHR